MEIKGVIFDLDGVITNSEVFAKESMKKAYEKNHLIFSEEDYIQQIGATKDFSSQLMRRFTNDETIEQVFADYTNFMNEFFEKGQIGFKKGAMELIRYLNERHFPICLASSAFLVKIQRSFTCNHEQVPFQNIVSCEDITKSKPDPEIFLKAAKKMNVDIHNCLVIEDSYQGVQAGYQAGAIVIMVPDMLPPNQNCLKQAFCIKKDLCEVLEFLKPYVNPSEVYF